MAELCNICERPATGHWGCGPRCAEHHYSEARSLEELRRDHARLAREIALRTSWRDTESARKKPDA